MNTAIVVTGLPASGKSTVGRRVAERLGCDFLDKDDFLEALFDERGVGDTDWRRMLSQESNQFFEQAARARSLVVLVSHWRPLDSSDASGTPTEWLKDAFEQIIELFCDCPTHLAVDRFIGRTRHEGHCDRSRHRHELSTWMGAYAGAVPLGIGATIRIDTAYDGNIDKVMRELTPLVASQ